MLTTALMFFATFLTSLGLCLVALMIVDRRRRKRRARMFRSLSQSRMVGMDGDAVASLTAMPHQTRSTTRARPQNHSLALLSDRLTRAGRSLSLWALIGAMAVLGISLGLLVLFFFGPKWGAVGVISGPILVIFWLEQQISQRARAFTEALPDALDVFGRGLRAGRPIPDSLGMIVQHSSGVLRDEFEICRAALQHGVTLQEAFAQMAHRVATPEMRFLCVATTLQSETGGNLIETLENLSAILRERRKLRLKARAVSAETRASSLILSALPVGVAVLLTVLNPGYIGMLVSDPRGQAMLAYAVFSVIAGILVMRWMGKVDA